MSCTTDQAECNRLVQLFTNNIRTAACPKLIAGFKRYGYKMRNIPIEPENDIRDLGRDALRFDALALTERIKYTEYWKAVGHRAQDQSVALFTTFGHLFGAAQRVLDLGCGNHSLKAAIDPKGMKWFGVDIAPISAMNPPINPWTFSADRHLEATLWELPIDWLGSFDAGICADVMEHIPEEKVGQVFAQALLACPWVLYSIALQKGPEGPFNTHCTVKPWNWWFENAGAARPASVVEPLLTTHSHTIFVHRRIDTPYCLPGGRFPLIQVARLRYRWEMPGYPNVGDFTGMYTAWEKTLAENPVDLMEHGGNRGAKLFHVWKSVSNVGLIHPLIVTPEMGGLHYVIVGNQRLCSVRGLNAGAPPDFEPISKRKPIDYARCIVMKPGDKLDDDTPAHLLYPTNP